MSRNEFLSKYCFHFPHLFSREQMKWAIFVWWCYLWMILKVKVYSYWQLTHLTNRETLNVSRFQQQQESINELLDIPNHGLRSLFSSKSQTFVLGQTNWADKFCGIWGIFSGFISNHFGTMSPFSMFSINQPLFLQKTSLYIHIPNIYLGLGFEFGSQRIRDLAIVCP